MFTFAKEERLRSKKAIDRLFSDGKSFHVAGFQVVHLSEPFTAGYPARILISVPRRKIRKAVMRNLLKRRIREAYRHHKQDLYKVFEANSVKCTFALIYTQSEVASYQEIEEKILSVIKRLEKEYEKAAR
jgi:ribonuclease P protein component